MKTKPLSVELTTAVLNHFYIAPAAPDVAFLKGLVNAYIRTVPWESVFRIVKRGKTAVRYDKIVEAMGGHGEFVKTAVVSYDPSATHLEGEWHFSPKTSPPPRQIMCF